jgi:hypothetical protein
MKLEIHCLSKSATLKHDRKTIAIIGYDSFTNDLSRKQVTFFCGLNLLFINYNECIRSND